MSRVVSDPQLDREGRVTAIERRLAVLERSAPLRTGVNVTHPSFGARGDGTTDDTDAIQAANDAAADLSDTLDFTTTVVFPLGHYKVDSKITQKARWVGEHPHSTQLVWYGSTGAGTIMVETETTGGFLGIENMNLVGGFFSGATEPETLLNIRTIIDKFNPLSTVGLYGCTGDAIKATEWINLHWRDIRWDMVGGYGLRLVPPVAQSGSTCVIEKFTSDHQRTANKGEGLICVDVAANSNENNIGHVVLSGGRIEVNETWNAPASVFTLKGTSSADRSATFKLRDVAYVIASGASAATYHVLYRDTTSAGIDQLILDSFIHDGVDNVYGGTWWGGTAAFPIGNYDWASLWEAVLHTPA